MNATYNRDRLLTLVKIINSASVAAGDKSMACQTSAAAGEKLMAFQSSVVAITSLNESSEGMRACRDC